MNINAFAYISIHVLPVNVLFCVVCSDLAVDLRMRMGDWFRVVQLLKTEGGAGMYPLHFVEGT